MLKQLRKKFILINMFLVSLILLAVFTAQVLSDWQQSTAETESALLRAVQWGESGPDPWHIGQNLSLLPENGTLIPTFCVILNSNGSVTAVLDNHVDISSDTLNTALSAALSSTSDTGKLPELGLRYLRAYTGGTLRVAFADITWARAALFRQVLTSLLILAAALVIFFLASLFLSRWALRPTERSWKQQQQFIADASHELKTPLTVLLANADILLAHPEDTIRAQYKWVAYIRDEGVRMKALVEDMLFLARSDSAAERELERKPLSLSDLCWNCVLSFEPVAFEQSVHLTQSIREQVTVNGDVEQLRRLVTILLDNACKYCPAGGTVTLTLEQEDGKALLTVHNTGTPIPPEALPHLFERFYRVDSARARQTGGYGLGLAIAASIAQRHRGKISAASSDGAGTAFSVALPLK